MWLIVMTKADKYRQQLIREPVISLGGRLNVFGLGPDRGHFRACWLREFTRIESQIELLFEIDTLAS